VRAGIFNEHFWGRLSLTLLPLALTLMVVACVHLASARRGGES
jgi:hypothetical protein